MILKVCGILYKYAYTLLLHTLGMLELECALKVDPRKENHTYHETVYTMAGSMVDVVDMYYSMTITAKSEIFLNLWKNYCLNAKHPMKITDLQLAIWEPTIKKCQEQLLKYQTLCVTFKELKEEFTQSIEPSHVMKELENLVKGMKLCGSSSNGGSYDTKWIKNIGKCIKTYQTLVQKHQSNAELILLDKPLQVMEGKLEDLEKIVKVTLVIVTYMYDLGGIIVLQTSV